MSEKSGSYRVRVRELRQTLSVYLRRVKDGETLSPYEGMLAKGRIRPAAGDLLEVEPLELAPGLSLTDTLLSMREEETR